MKICMKYGFFLISLVFPCTLFTSAAFAKTAATFQKKGQKKVQSISLRSARTAYRAVSQATLNTPSRSQFMRDYVRYHIALNEAYNDRSLITASDIQRFIVNPDLKKSFDDILYKVYASSKMQTSIQAIEKEVRNLSDKALRDYYGKNPYYRFHFVLLNIPSLASQKELTNIRARALSIYQKIKKSKKPFPQLISLYSDNPSIGYSGNVYSRSSLYPLLYSALGKLKINQVSRPIQTPNGYYILRLNEVVPFNRAIRNDIKEQIYNARTEKVFNNTFNQMMKSYKVNIDEQAVRSL